MMEIYYKVTVAEEKKIPLELHKLKMYGGLIYLEQVLESKGYAKSKRANGVILYDSKKRGNKNYNMFFNGNGFLIDYRECKINCVKG
jgi:hypothetical protein